MLVKLLPVSYVWQPNIHQRLIQGELSGATNHTPCQATLFVKLYLLYTFFRIMVLNALCSSRLRNVVLLLHFEESSRCRRNILSSQLVMFWKVFKTTIRVDGSEVHNITCSILRVFDDQRLNWILGEWWWR